MANTIAKIKSGMGGSRNGRSRWDYTEVLKKETKKRRRDQGKLASKDVEE